MRFRYQPVDKKSGEIFEGIQALDREGMDAIETANPDVFHEYIQRTKNTICGRKPISLILVTSAAAGLDFSWKFVFYSQSSQAVSMEDSSVSYAACVVREAH
jgi:MEMO1 family protein